MSISDVQIKTKVDPELQNLAEVMRHDNWDSVKDAVMMPYKRVRKDLAMAKWTYHER